MRMNSKELIMPNIYAELTRVGISNEVASELTESVNRIKNLVTKQDLEATKQDLKVALLELETTVHKELHSQTKYMIYTMIAMTGIFGVIVKLL